MSLGRANGKGIYESRLSPERDAEVEHCWLNSYVAKICRNYVSALWNEQFKHKDECIINFSI